MSFWDDLKENAREFVDGAKEMGERALCFAGLHSGEWKYVNHGSCEQKYVCIRLHCDHTDTRKLHESWSSWLYFKQNSCLKERHCIRCKAREEKEIHQSWTEWEYTAKNNCDQVRNCERCEKKDYREQHNFGSERHLTYMNDCIVHELCKRCGYKKALPAKDHKWTTIKHPTIPNQYRNYCPRCKAIEDVDNL